MFSRGKSFSCCFLLAGLMLAEAAPADTLVTTSGDVYVGTITKTTSGYTVKPTGGDPVNIAAADVKKVLLDHPDPAAIASGAIVPGSTTPAANHGKIDPRTLKALLGQGKTAFDTGSFSDARDAFDDALLVDSTNVTAGRGLGFAYLRLGKPLKAAKPLEVAAAATPKMDRSLTLAISSSLVTAHNPMRAVKYIKAYLEAHMTPNDEPMLNAFGIALSQVDTSATHGALYKDATKLYTKLNTELEETQPGKKRWGVEWLDAGEVDRKLAGRQAAQKKADEALAKAQSFDSQIASTKDELASVGLSSGSNKNREAKAQKLKDKISQLLETQTKAQSDSDQAATALSEVPKPDFPPAISMEDVALTLEPAGSTSVATNKPDSATVAAAAHAPAVPDRSNDATPKRTNPAQTAANTNTPTPADETPPAAPKPVVTDRHVTRYAVAFAVAPDLVVTASDTVATATDIHIETTSGISMKADIVRTDQGLGLALLRVEGAHMATLETAPMMTHGTLKAWGFPEVSLFNPAPQPMPCVASTPTANGWTIKFQMSPRLPGGPVLQDGSIVGVEMATRDSDPSEVPGIPLDAFKKFLSDDAKPGRPTADPKSAIVQIVAEH